ncbi:hypothetical protein ACI2KR_06600 [Pseudomonas luteola]
MSTNSQDAPLLDQADMKRIISALDYQFEATDVQGEDALNKALIARLQDECTRLSSLQDSDVLNRIIQALDYQFDGTDAQDEDALNKALISKIRG